MDDKDKTKKQLISELAEMRQRLAALEAMEAERRQTQETLRRRERELSLLDRAGQEFTARLDAQQLIEQLLRAASGIIGAEGASVWLREEGPEGWLVCRMAYHQGEKRTPVNLRLRPGQGVAGWVAEKREIAFVSNAQKDPRFFAGIDQQTGFHTTTLLAIPLRTRDQVIGVLEVVNKLEGDFDGKDRALAETLAASAAIAIDNARLVETLRQRTTDLQSAYQRVEALTQALSDGIRGPLMQIVSTAQALEEVHAALSAEELQQRLQRMAQAGREVIKLIDELPLTPAGVPSEIQEAIGPLNMANIVADVLERLAYLIKEYQVEVTLPKRWPTALGHAAWVEEVWANYLSNAIKHGGRPPRLELGAVEHRDGTIRFWVRDNGPGLAPETQARLFAPATQIDRDVIGDYGVGLALAQRIVEKLGGRVGVESQAGQGSLFFFTLPAAA